MSDTNGTLYKNMIAYLAEPVIANRGRYYLHEGARIVITGLIGTAGPRNPLILERDGRLVKFTSGQFASGREQRGLVFVFHESELVWKCSQ